jgi:hypothetical protein
MAKDQFKQKVKIEALTTRFSVLPLIDKGEDALCVDANFNFLLVSKAKLAQYTEIALPETFDTKLFETAKEKARAFLPKDNKKIEGLVTFLKANGAKGFQEALDKALAN